MLTVNRQNRILARIAAVFLAVLLALSCNALPAASAAADEWQKAYIDILKSVGVTSQFGFVVNGVESVSVIDLTNDGIPELVFTNIEEGDNWPIHFSVYSYSSGKTDRVIYIDALEHVVSACNYDVYLTNSGDLIARGGNGGEDSEWSQYYLYKGWELVQEVKLRHNFSWNDNTGEVYFIDDSKVTKAQYEAEQNRIYEGAKYCLVSDAYTGLRSGTTDKSMTYEEAITYLTQLPSTPTIYATPTNSTVLVNGNAVAFDAYNINGNNYFKLRDLAYILNGTEKQFEVSWDGASNTIILVSGQSYTSVGGEMQGKGAGDKTPTATTSKILLDGKEVTFTAYNVEGNNYFKLRDIGQTFDFGVTWDGANNTIVIDTSIGYIPE